MIDVPPFWRRVARLGGLVVMGVGGLLTEIETRPMPRKLAQ